MIIGVPKEIYPGERRVALVPAVLPTLTKAGFEVHIQAGAGIEAGYADSLYTEKGAKIVADRAAVFAAADIVAQVLCYGANEINGEQDVPLYRRESDISWVSASIWIAGGRQADRQSRCHLVFRGVDAPHHSRPEHGCAFFDGNCERVQGRVDGCRLLTPASFPCSLPQRARLRRRACLLSAAAWLDCKRLRRHAAWARWFLLMICGPL